MTAKKRSKQIYQKIETQNLIVYAIYSIAKNKEVCTYERLVKECYEQFPKIFSLKNYPQWPDSLKLDRPMRTLRQKGFLVGSARGNFELTRFGLNLAHETELAIQGKTQKTSGRMRESVGRGIDNKIVLNVKQSDAFQRYLQNPQNFSLSEAEFRSILRCTLETPERVVKQNLEYHRKVAEQLGDKDVIQFLSESENRLHKGERMHG
jgi:hypothetical protein